MAAALFFVLVFDLDAAADGFAEGDARVAELDFDAEFAFHALGDDVDVHVADAAGEQLVGFEVLFEGEGGVLVGHAGEGVADLILVAFVFGFDGHGEHGLGIDDGVEDKGLVFVTEGVAGLGFGHLGNDGEVAGVGDGHGVLGLAAHGEDGADALALFAGGVIEGGVGFELAGEDADVAEAADEGVGGGFEDQGGEGVGDFALDRFFVGGVAALGDGVFRRGGVGDDGVEELLGADVLVGGAAQYGAEFALGDAFDEAGADFVVAQFFAFEVFGEQVVVGFGGGLDHGEARFGGFVLEVGRDVAFGVLGALGVGRGVSFHLDEVDDAFEAFLGADGELDGHDVVAEFFPHLGDGGGEVGVFTVHLVDEGEPGHTGFFGIFPDVLGADLNPGGAAEDDKRGVHRPERAFDFGDEVGVAGGVEEIYLMVAPFARRESGADRHLAFYFFGLEVGGGRAVVYFTETGDGAGAEQQRFRERGFACATVGEDADVTDFVAFVLFQIKVPLAVYS